MKKEKQVFDVVINKSAALVIRGGKLLVVRERDEDFWITVGGAVNPGETMQDALEREVLEEIGVEPLDSKHYAIFDGHTMDGKSLRIFAHLCEIKGDPEPCGEIAELAWVGRDFDKGTPLLKRILERLATDGLIGE